MAQQVACKTTCVDGKSVIALAGIISNIRPAMSIEGRERSRLLLSLRCETAFGLRAISSTSGGILPDASAGTSQFVGKLTDKLLGISTGIRGLAPASADAMRKTPEVALPNASPATVTAFTSAKLPINVPVLSTEKKSAALMDMNAKEVSRCTKCTLHTTRTQTVFGEGDVNAKIFFIGEGPGENEDMTGRPFVGRAGQLLDRMILAMGISREQVFIANIVKCRPPDNRVPAPDEVATCTPYLVRQLEIIRPKVIVTLGLPAVKYMLENPKLSMGKIRGQWNDWRGIKLMPTYHPSYVLRAYTEANRQAVWSDLQMVMKEVGLAAKRVAPN